MGYDLLTPVRNDRLHLLQLLRSLQSLLTRHLELVRDILGGDVDAVHGPEPRIHRCRVTLNQSDGGHKFGEHRRWRVG